MRELLAATTRPLITAIACMLLCACTQPKAINLVMDSQLSQPAQFWTMGGAMQIRHGLGPRGDTIVYYHGNGSASSYRDFAAFWALVVPGQTYTFSCYLNAVDHRDTVPYVFLSAANGTWRGTQVYQATAGRVQSTFTIPALSGTTIVRGYFTPQGGIYPIERGAIFSEPQLELGRDAHEYEPSKVETRDRSADAYPNLVLDSAIQAPDRYWSLGGAFHVANQAGPERSNAIVYAGTGKPSGRHNFAAFVAPVVAGQSYVFSAYMDAERHMGAPANAVLTALDGTWRGIDVLQTGRGRVFVGFSIPRKSGTTIIRGYFTTQNATYPTGHRLLIAQPQIESGSVPHAYAPGPFVASLARAGNLVPPLRDWRTSGAMLIGLRSRQIIATYVGTGRPSGYGNSTSFHAAVRPGATYAFTCVVDPGRFVGTPPYVLIMPDGGTFAARGLYQASRGKIVTVFSIPPGSRTTSLRFVFTPQNGRYSAGQSVTWSSPDLRLIHYRAR